MKKLSVTDKQLAVIRDACELYGRVQIRQFTQLGEIISRTGFSGDNLRYDRDYNDEYKHDQTISGCIEAALRGITQEFWEQSDRQGEHDKRTDAEMIAMDIWAALDGRLDDGFCMGTEPLVKVEYDDSPNEKPKTGRWVKVGSFFTPGGDPFWKCSVCGKGMHVYGAEHGSYGDDVSDGQWVACPNCGSPMDI